MGNTMKNATKKIITVLILLTFTTAFMACTKAQKRYTLDTIDATTEYEGIKNKYADIVVLVEVMQDKQQIFTENEWRTYEMEIKPTFIFIISKFDSIMNLDFAKISLDDIAYYKRIAVDNYKKARQIIVAHEKDFSPATWIILKDFDNQAVEMSKKIDNILENPTHESVSQALTLTLGIVNISLQALKYATSSNLLSLVN